MDAANTNPGSAKQSPRFLPRREILLVALAIVLVGSLNLVPILLFYLSHSFTSIVSKEFILVDSSGKARAELGCLADGSPWFGMRDANSKVRMTICVHDSMRSVVNLCDKDQNPILVLSCEDNGVCQIAFADKDRSIKVLLGADTSSDKAGLLFMRNGEETQGSFYFDPQGEEGLTVFEPSGKKKVFIGRDEQGQVTLGVKELDDAESQDPSDPR